MIFADFLKALGQLGDPRFRRVLWLGLGLTLALLVAMMALFVGVIDWLAPDETLLPLFGTVTWVGDFLSFTAIFLMLFLSVFLMVPVASAFTGLFLEDIAEAVEDRHYPDLPEVARIGIYDTIRDSINFFGVLVAVNTVAIAAYFLVGPLAPLLFWALNGYLLGREYFQMVAMRRLGRDGATRLRRKHWLRVWFAGVLMAVPLSVPLVNLIIPILGVATFTHQFHRLARPPSG
ncbi:MAG: EI24 domain-containing protein [Rhodobacter sp.]|nr:EI24 domain-containing protein [Rhodobacter sp.]